MIMLTVTNRMAFKTASIALLYSDVEGLESCVWHGPKDSLVKPALWPVYGDELDRLFRKILRVPNATSIDALEHMDQLRSDDSTTIADVTDIYVFLQKYHADTYVECSVLNE